MRRSDRNGVCASPFLVLLTAGCQPLVTLDLGDASAGEAAAAGSSGNAGADGDSSGGPSFGSTGGDGTGSADEPEPTDEYLRIAFFGDHGLGGESESTLELVRSEGAAALVILGDFDYHNDPTAYHNQLDAGLGETFPVFAVAGNHDVAEWEGYREIFIDRLAAIAEADCEGDIGIQMGCRFRGLELVLSGVGTMPATMPIGHERFIANRLTQSSAIWRVCAWHKNQRDMQVGTKTDEVGWAAYEVCEAGGAIVATGHEHSYARTRTLTAVGYREIGHGATGPDDELSVGLGRNFVFVSGLGGSSIRNYSDLHEKDTWWAAAFTRNWWLHDGEWTDLAEAEIKVVPGVAFIDFHVDGDPKKARGYFKTIAGDVLDEYVVWAD